MKKKVKNIFFGKKLHGIELLPADGQVIVVTHSWLAGKVSMDRANLSIAGYHGAYKQLNGAKSVHF